MAYPLQLWFWNFHGTANAFCQQFLIIFLPPECNLVMRQARFDSDSMPYPHQLRNHILLSHARENRNRHSGVCMQWSENHQDHSSPADGHPDMEDWESLKCWTLSSHLEKSLFPLTLQPSIISNLQSLINTTSTLTLATTIFLHSAHYLEGLSPCTKLLLFLNLAPRFPSTPIPQARE